MPTVLEYTKKIQKMEILLTLNKTKVKILELIMAQSNAVGIHNVDKGLFDILDYINKEREEVLQ